MATEKQKGRISKTLDAAKDLARESMQNRTRDLVYQSLGGGGLLANAASKYLDRKFNKDGEKETETQKALNSLFSVQSDTTYIITRMESIVLNISDNIYNIAGFLGAQLTSMQEAQREAEFRQSIETAAAEELATESAQKGGLTGDPSLDGKSDGKSKSPLQALFDGIKNNTSKTLAVVAAASALGALVYGAVQAFDSFLDEDEGVDDWIPADTLGYEYLQDSDFRGSSQVPVGGDLAIPSDVQTDWGTDYWSLPDTSPVFRQPFGQPKVDDIPEIAAPSEPEPLAPIVVSKPVPTQTPVPTPESQEVTRQRIVDLEKGIQVQAQARSAYASAAEKQGTTNKTEVQQQLQMFDQRIEILDQRLNEAKATLNVTPAQQPAPAQPTLQAEPVKPEVNTGASISRDSVQLQNVSNQPSRTAMNSTNINNNSGEIDGGEMTMLSPIAGRGSLDAGTRFIA